MPKTLNEAFLFDPQVQYLTAKQREDCKTLEEEGPYVNYSYDNGNEKRHVLSVRFPVGWVNEHTIKLYDKQGNLSKMRTPGATEEGTDPRIWFKDQEGNHHVCTYKEWKAWDRRGQQTLAEPVPKPGMTPEEKRRYATYLKKHQVREEKAQEARKVEDKVEKELEKRAKAK